MGFSCLPCFPAKAALATVTAAPTYQEEARLPVAKLDKMKEGGLIACSQCSLLGSAQKEFCDNCGEPMAEEIPVKIEIKPQEIPVKIEIKAEATAAPLGVIETNSNSCSTEKFSAKFNCPHCCKQFQTEAALYQHDPCMDMPEVTEAFSSGNGTISSVGVKLDGRVECSKCSQKFDSEKALEMHCKFIHAQETEMNVGYELVYQFNDNKLVKNVH